MAKKDDTTIKKKAGRPRIEIDKNIFENLCAIQCTLTEVAGVLGCSEDTILRYCHKEYGMTFADVFKIKSVHGKVSLRRNMFKMAETNVSMAIWLSKQYLGMKDVVETESKTDNRIEIVWEEAPTDED